MAVSPLPLTGIGGGPGSEEGGHVQVTAPTVEAAAARAANAVAMREKEVANIFVEQV